MPVQVYNTGDSIREIIKTVRTEAVKANLDPHFGGAYFEGNETFWQMLMIVIVALLMLYFILASQFESLTLPLIVLIEIPIDVAMTLLALWICGISLNLMSMIGIVVMSGIVINDSILKIDIINQLRFALIPFLWGDDIGSQLQRPLAVAMISGMTIGTLVSLYWVPLCYYYLVRKKGE